MLGHLRTHLKGKVIILGIGNTFRSDDGAGSLLAVRIKDKVPYTVYDVGPNPENYLGKVIREKPDTILLIDAVDFNATPGELNLLEGKDVETVNLFSTHNASLSLAINYLQNNLKADIIILALQPKTVALGDELSDEMSRALERIEKFFYETSEQKEIK